MAVKLMLMLALGLPAVYGQQCSNGHVFPVSLEGVECWGLSLDSTAISADSCLNNCCNNATCAVWNWHPEQKCWRGATYQTCRPVANWSGGIVNAGETIMKMQPSSAAKPLPIAANNTDPDGNVFSVDSTSYLMNGERFYPIGGEIHPARIPPSQWRNELLKMRAGGLNSLSVYFFWIHYEEVEGQTTLTGRRDIQTFLQLVKDLNFTMMARIGPWCHGEARNGGHPDWLVAKSKAEGFRLRSTDAKYLSYVRGWYTLLAEQLKGMYFKDGGPITLVQVDNETPDLAYLSALRVLAMDVGIAPAVFTKTGWPSPSSGYPPNYPMVPYFGGYADLFWTNAMAPAWSASNWMFGSGPSLATVRTDDASTTKMLKYQVPAGYPWVDVEQGGGMTAAYNHRVHMDSSDMPSMHLTMVASGLNGLGYYMYHGGNNPHSVRYNDDPNVTMQESSFQPAGAANPMTSIQYDFFAPIGEFGQTREHYHQMRALHVFLLAYGRFFADTTPAMPLATPVGDNDVTTLRWEGRFRNSSGVIFVNNYQRMTNMPVKQRDHLTIRTVDGSATYTIPSPHSQPLMVAENSWFHWPLNFPVAEGFELSWATAQIMTKVSINASFTTVFLAESRSQAIELAFPSGYRLATSYPTAAINSSQVVYNIVPSYDAAVVATASNGHVVQFVVLPNEHIFELWTGVYQGQETVVISNAEAIFIQPDRIDIKTNLSHPKAFVYPPPANSQSSGVFANLTAVVPASPPMTISVKLESPAGPARDLPVAPSGKAQEPTIAEWQAAQKYTLAVSGLLSDPKFDVRLRLNYQGDASRVYYQQRCLTDSWYTGYTREGAPEVGLSYLMEDAQLPETPFVLEWWVLPLKKASLATQVYINHEVLPEFDAQGLALNISDPELIIFTTVQLL